MRPRAVKGQAVEAAGASIADSPSPPVTAALVSTMLLGGLLGCSLCWWLAWRRCMRRREAARLRRETREEGEQTSLTFARTARQRRDAARLLEQKIRAAATGACERAPVTTSRFARKVEVEAGEGTESAAWVDEEENDLR